MILKKPTHFFPYFLVTFALIGLAQVAEATLLSVPTTVDYLLVGRGPSTVAVATKVSSSNSLGRIYTVPSSTDPDVDDNPPWPMPAHATPPTEGIFNDGNVALTHVNGTYEFSDIDIWAGIGVRCVDGATTNCRAGWSGSTLTLTNGTFANDPVAMAAIESELVAAHASISGLTETGAWSVTGAGFKNGANQWQLDSNGVDEVTTITLGPGANFIVIDTDGNDMKINNSHLVVDGPADSSAIFLLEDQSKNFLFENSSISVGLSGIGHNTVLFAMLDGGNDTNFNFSKMIVNGVSYWDLSEDGGKFTMNNVQGCAQCIGDHLDFNDVQLARCAFGVPEPSTLALFFVSACLLASGARRRS
jgi:hypothetical protein